MSTPLHLLIVEDSVDDADLVAQRLSNADFTVRYERVEDAPALRSALRERTWDAVVSDYRMPRFDGLAALALVRSTGLDIPFILISGTVGEETAVAAMKAGANDYMMKDNLARLAPVMRRELQEAARRAELRRAQGELEKLSVAVRQSGIGIVITDPDGIIEFVNPGFEKMCGYTAAEIVGKNPRFLQSGHVLPGVYRDLWENVLAGREWRGVIQNRRKDGELYWEDQHISPVLDEGGQIRNFIAIKDDITAKKRNESELERLHSAMDLSLDSIYLTDVKTLRFVYVNDAACVRLGFPREQLLRMGPHEVLGVDQSQIRQEFSEVIAAGTRGTTQEHRYSGKDGAAGWTELRRRAIDTSDRQLIVTIGRDITERREADQRIRRLNRVYAVLSGINATIVRVRTRDELFREACRIAVEAGGFASACIAIADSDGQSLVATDQYGTDAQYMPKLGGSLSLRNGAADEPEPVTAAFRGRHAIVVNDVRTDPLTRTRGRAESAVRAAAFLPLSVDDKAAGVLELDSTEAGFFDAAEMRLLNELASDMSFALDHISKGERLQFLAFYDPLTGLANRALFGERLDQALLGGQKSALIVVDIENLRSVNESLGREAGDAVVIQFARRLAAATAGKSSLARTSANMFAFLLQPVKGKSEVERSITHVRTHCFAEPFVTAGAELVLGARFGIAFAGGGINAEVLLRNAEAALVKAKSLGEQRYFHNETLTSRSAARLMLSNKLRQALEKDQFVLHYQPKVELEHRRIVGVEALIRWQSPELGLVPPAKFIPLMEETGLILEAGAWALSQAVRDHARWLGLGLTAPRVAVNVSAIQLRSRNFVATIEAALGRAAVSAGIDLEITESMIMDDVEENIRKLTLIRDLGLNISIDDFGTGYSSLAYLSKLPIDTIKIDRSFVIRMLEDPDTMTLVRTIISLAHSLKRKVVAEGVDQEEQAEILRLLNCDQMQGYLYSKPVPFDQLTALLQREKPAGASPAKRP